MLGRMATLTITLAIGTAGLWVAGCIDPTSNLNSSDPNKVVEGVRECAKKPSDEVIERVAKVVGHQDKMVAAEAVRSLGDMRRAEAVKVLKDVASGATEKRSAVRQEAVEQLGRQKDPEALNMLRQVIQRDPDPAVRAAAATGFARQQSLPDVALLVQVAETETDPMVQARAVGAVERVIGLRFGYDPKAPPEERKKALMRMRSKALEAAAVLQSYQNQRNRK